HTAETAPVWTRDGRWLFATSIYANEKGKAQLASIVYVDLAAREPRALRILREPSAPTSRLGVTLAPAHLDDATLAKGPDYRETLQQILLRAHLQQIEREQERTGGGQPGDGDGAP